MSTNTALAVVSALFLGACCSTQPPAPAPAPAPVAAAEELPPAEVASEPHHGIIIPSAPPTVRSKTILHELVNGRTENVLNDFTPQLKQTLPAEKLTASWNDLVTRLGDYRNMGEPVAAEEEGRKVVYVPLMFEKGTVRAKLVYDQTNYVSGLSFVP
jgi:Protein of unknown function (DUF3887)